MTGTIVALWIVAILATTAALVLAVVAVRRRAWGPATAALVPVAVGFVLLALQVDLPAPSRVLPVLLAAALGGLGVVAGGPLTMAVLDRTARDADRRGDHGGILVDEDAAPGRAPREVLRGGSVIGYLERLAIVGAIALGHPEAIAVVVAVKGLGRFSELDTSEARERFIIGTLVSLIWATACGALIALGVV